MTIPEKKAAFWFLLVWPPVAAFLCIAFNFNIAICGTLFYILPIWYLSRKIPGERRKIFVISAALAMLWLSLDYIWEASGAWIIHSTFPWRLFEIISIEMIAWSFAWPYLTISVYEYFFEKDKRFEKTRPATRAFLKVASLLFALTAFYAIFISNPIRLPYSYVLLSSVFFVPMIAILYKFPKLIHKFLGISVYFFYQSFIIELTALHLGYWSFPIESGYIGYISLFQFHFPIEEFFLWIVFGTFAILSWYEFFDDDRK